jgi:hypothetical protein
MWRSLLWLAVLACAVALNDLEGRYMTHEAAVPKPRGRTVLMQEDSRAPTGPEYDKLPGMSFDEDSVRVSVKSKLGCEQACNHRGNQCNSFSFHEVTKECIVSPLEMLFDPNSVLSIRKESGGYFKVPGLSYFHDHQGEWLKTAITDDVKCDELCGKAKNCKAYKFNSKSHRCYLTGKKVVFGPEWSYYSKKGSRQDPPDEPEDSRKENDKSAKTAGVVQIAEIETEILNQKSQLKREKARLVAEKAEAKREIAKRLQNSQTLEVMREQLEQAKVSAKHMVQQVMKEKQLEAQSQQLKAEAKAEAENADAMIKKSHERATAMAKLTKEGAAKKVKVVADRLKTYESQNQERETKQELKMTATKAQAQAVSERNKAEAEDRAVAPAQSSLEFGEGRQADELKTKKMEHAQMMMQEAHDEAAAEKEAKSLDAMAVDRAVEALKAKLSAKTEAVVANSTATERQMQAEHDLEWQKFSLENQLQKKQEHALRSDLAEEESHQEQLITELKTERERAEEMEDMVAHAGTNTKPLKVEPTAEEKMLLRALAKAKQEADNQRVHEELLAATAIRKARAEADKVKAAADKKMTEHRFEAAEVKQKTKDAKAQAEIDRANKYAEQMNYAQMVRNASLQHVLAVEKQATELPDDEGDKLLKVAKKQYRASVQAALESADKFKAKTTKVPVTSKFVTPSQMVEVGQVKEITARTNTTGNVTEYVDGNRVPIAPVVVNATNTMNTTHTTDEDILAELA